MSKQTSKAPDLSGRVWAAWAFKTEAEARRAAAFLTTPPDGVEFVISQGVCVKAEDGDTTDEGDSQGEGWHTGEPGARADVYKAGGFCPWRMVWSVLAEPMLTQGLEEMEEDGGSEMVMWLSPFDLSAAMEEAGLDPVRACDPETENVTDEAYDFGQPERVRPYAGPTTCNECEGRGELNEDGLCCGCQRDTEEADSLGLTLEEYKADARDPLDVLRSLVQALRDEANGNPAAMVGKLDDAEAYLFGRD